MSMHKFIQSPGFGRLKMPDDEPSCKVSRVAHGSQTVVHTSRIGADYLVWDDQGCLTLWRPHSDSRKISSGMNGLQKCHSHRFHPALLAMKIFTRIVAWDWLHFKIRLDVVVKATS